MAGINPVKHEETHTFEGFICRCNMIIILFMRLEVNAVVDIDERNFIEKSGSSVE
jgi:hypothetical protein